MTDRPTPARNRRVALTERSLLRISEIVREVVAEAERAVPDVQLIQGLVGQAYDIGSEVGSLPLRKVAAERDLARARVAELEASLADKDHTIESLRIRVPVRNPHRQ